jgi:Fic family protein
MTVASVPSWPALDVERRPWDWDAHGPRPRRSLGLPDVYEAAVPPFVADLPVRPEAPTTAALEAAREAVRALDASTTVDLTALAGALLRSESVASSKIEHLRASQREVGLAMLRGVPVRSAAAHVAANVRAMSAALAQGAATADYHVADLLHVHRLLLEADPYEGGWAGRVRDMQNWVGGGDVSPHGALFVPPAPERVPGLLDDLVRFCRRTDVDPVAQAAVAHAQFETVHPFTDGNGRTGRALVGVVLRRRGLARTTVVPVSTVLLADVEGYFDGLGDYRAGRLDPWLTRFAAATSLAASAGQRLANELAAVREDWWEAVRPRRGSAVATLTEALLRQPVVDIDVLRDLTAGVADKNVYAAVARLESAGVLTELSGGGRNQVWAALDVLDLLERFEARLGRRRAG